VREEVKAGWKVIGCRALGYLCCIAPRPDGSVRLGLEHGGMLADARGVLDSSTGTQMRWVTLRDDTSMDALRD
jgi:hypothetical protein